MSRRRPLRLARAVFLLAGTILFTTNMRAQSGALNGEWLYYGGDAGSTKYSPLDQINKDNVKDLRIAWRWKAENFGARPDFNFQVTPVMAKGVIYTTAGTRRDVVAIDASTGETLWMWRYDESRRGQTAPRVNSGRGVAYWSDGKDERIVYITPGYHLVALDAKTGRAVPTFGKEGVVDLYEGFDQPAPADGLIGSSSPPIVVRNVIVVGAAHQAASPTKENVAGFVRGYDVRTGKRVWIFHTIPRPGEFGHETWEEESWKYTGNTAVWAPMSADEELGYVYLPIETPTNDSYGGHRKGNNLFAESLVCLDATTGRRVWHFQMIHHGIWDWDLPAAPNLVNITVNGRQIKAVAQITKQAWTFVFDRATGQPVWPIEERPVPQSDVPGEKTSSTQPFPTRPAPFDRQGVTTDDLIDFTPELKAEALKIAANYQLGPIFTPPIVAGSNGLRGVLSLPASFGGGNWQGAGFDPETGILYVSSLTSPGVLAVVKDPKRSSMNFVSGGGGGFGAAPPTAIVGERLGPQGLPLIKPPYGRITAIDLNSGEHVWMVPNADTPESIKNHPALKGVTLPRTGTPDRSGIVVTKTLVFAGEGAASFGAMAALNGGGPMFRAYDKKTGAIISELRLPGNQSGVPMTYMKDGKQYILVPISGRGQPAELVALSLP